MKFSTGNRVQVISKSGMWCGLSGEVTEVDVGPLTEEERYYVKVDGHRVFCYYASELELAVLDELAKVIS